MEADEWQLTKDRLDAFHAGRLTDAYAYFGSHVHGGQTVFTVWVPDVVGVAVLLEMAGGKERSFPLAQHPEDISVWQVRIPQNLSGARYEYRIETADGLVFHKADPYARQAELRPQTRSIVCPDSHFDWSSQGMEQKKRLAAGHMERPLAIYEVHAGMWKRGDGGRFLTYRELADKLIPYVREAGFTHIELLPLTEHPLDESWGYQATGFFASTSRYGEPDGLRFFVDRCAQAGVGVFLDWIPGHFCSDLFALASFNGTPLYEETRSVRRLNPKWGTMNFDVRKGEVVSFLLSSAHYWLTEFRFDGFRMDALIAQLFIPNDEAGKRNEEGANFLRSLTRFLKQQHPDAILIGEDAENYPGVTSAVEEGGIGFHYKWNFGWVHDVLTYMRTPPENRSAIHKNLNFSMHYQYDDRFILSLSHDEVANGQTSLVNQLPGTTEERFRQLRLLLGYWIAHPGKKLLFMGQEFGQAEEWIGQPELDWASQNRGIHAKTALFTKKLLAFYRNEGALYELDSERAGFEWLDADNAEGSTLAFIRRGRGGEELIVVCNFSGRRYERFRVGVPETGMYEQVFSTEDSRFGGELEAVPSPAAGEVVEWNGQRYSVEVDMPALCMTVWKRQKEG